MANKSFKTNHSIKTNNSYLAGRQVKLKIQKTVRFLTRNYILSIFLVCILFVGMVVVARTVFSKPTYVYVKVKVGQGLWWVSTARSPIWLVDSIKKGDVARSLTGQTTAEILSKRYYRWYSSDQFDIYVALKLKAGYNRKTGAYSFNRSVLSVGSPIDIQFPRVDITGTVINISKTPFKDEYVEKIIYLVYQGGYYKDFPYRYDNIKIGDTYFDGQDKVFEIIDKSLEKNIWNVANNLTAQLFERDVETTQNIVVKAKVILKKKGNALYYGEDYKIIDNVYIPFATDNYFFENFAIRKIE